MKPTNVPTIRQATEADAWVIAEVHVAAWREAYLGLLPDAEIERLNVPGRAERWRSILGHSGAEAITFIADTEVGTLGFVSCGRQRDSTLIERGFTGEIAAIYVLRQAHRRGIGRTLMSAAAQSLSDQGHATVALWSLRDNHPARGFYERLGGRVVDTRRDRRGSHTLHEVAYGWCDAEALARPTPSGLIEP